MRLKISYIIFIFISWTFLACSPAKTPKKPAHERSQNQDVEEPDLREPPRPEERPQNNPVAPVEETQSAAQALSADFLKDNYGFKIRGDQPLGDRVPPQVGTFVKGKQVELDYNGDLPWSAFTLVLYPSSQGGFKILTQKRKGTYAGTIETAGGHLEPGETWREGARKELFQEAGVNASVENFHFQQGGNFAISGRTDKPYGNMNFFLVFDKRPKTSNKSSEVDGQYGHQWLDLKTTYLEVKNEQALKKRDPGRYYHFFRNHLINFCTQVIECEKL